MLKKFKILFTMSAMPAKMNAKATPGDSLSVPFVELVNQAPKAIRSSSACYNEIGTLELM